MSFSLSPQILVLPALLVLLLHQATGSSYADGGDGMACWKAKLMVPCDSMFPGVNIEVTVI